jgi:hypothetical protein
MSLTPRNAAADHLSADASIPPTTGCSPVASLAASEVGVLPIWLLSGLRFQQQPDLASRTAGSRRWRANNADDQPSAEKFIAEKEPTVGVGKSQQPVFCCRQPCQCPSHARTCRCRGRRLSTPTKHDSVHGAGVRIAMDAILVFIHLRAHPSLSVELR